MNVPMPHDHSLHDHSHGHGHRHGHVPAPGRHDRAFAVGMALNVGFVLVEVGFGVAANSMALLADAGHNLSDVLGLLLAWGAVWLERRRPTGQRTYGYGRSSILAALANGVTLLIAVGAIAWEAVLRLAEPQPVAGIIVIVVAGCGVAVNGLTMALFMAGRERDLNIRGAFLHMAADTAVSAGVVIAGLVIRATGWQWLDPATSLIIAAVITVSTWQLLVSAVNLALDAVPEHIERAAVETYLAGLPGIA